MWFYHCLLVFHLCITPALYGAAALLMSQWVILLLWSMSNLRRLKINAWSLYFLQIWSILVAVLSLFGFVARCSWKCFGYSSTIQPFQKIAEIWCFLRKNILGAAWGYHEFWSFCLQSVWFCFWCRTPIPFHRCVCLFCWDFMAF